jgi:hypothetical protein
MLEPVKRHCLSVHRSETMPSESVRNPARPRLWGGSADGNEWLTTATGILLLAPLAVLGVTIIRIGQLTWLHLFLGLLLMGPVALKMASTGYRFARYYTGSSVYGRRGPPPLALRVIAPAVVASTVVVFATGVVLLFEGPRNRGLWLTLHKVSFFAWLAFTAFHVLGHLPEVGRLLRVPRSDDGDLRIAGGDGAGGRLIALVGAVVAGVVLAVVLIPDFGVWTAAGALHHHHD